MPAMLASSGMATVACNRAVTLIRVDSISEYDIDLLEDSSYVKDTSCTDIEFSAEPMDVVKVIFLGAQGVGKTSVIQVRGRMYL